MACVLLLLLLPSIQARFHFSKEAGLAGAFTQASRPELSWLELRSNSYQPALEHYAEDQIGFRPYFIKIRNQLAFSLFRVVRSPGLVVGRQEVLFQQGPIDSYLGKDVLPAGEVRFRVRRLRAVQQQLARRGVQLLFVMAPNKARFQPEDLPAYLRDQAGLTTNYDLFTRQMRADSVNLLDMVPAFARWKTTSPYPLFPRGGAHWSGYGIHLAADTLCRRLEQLCNLQLPTVRSIGRPRIVTNSDSVHPADNDLRWILNLLWQVDIAPLAYPNLVFDPPRPGQTRPSVLLVGDSFGWGLMLLAPYLQRQFAPDTRFWYYNNAVYQPDSINHATGEVPDNLDLAPQLETRRAVVLLLTEHNLTEREFGFIERVYRHYHPFTAADLANIAGIAKRLERAASWEEAAKGPDHFKEQLYAKAQQQYERSMR